MNYDILPLFAIPIYTSKVNTEIINNVKNILPNITYENISNGYMSKNKYILNDSVFFETKNVINENLNNYLTNVIKLQKNISHKILNSWVMKHEKNNFSHRHFHQNSLISGILYIQTDENSGNLIFHKTSTYRNLFPISIKPTFTEWNIFNSECWNFLPSSGFLILFPSFLDHSVTVSKSELDRYCIAFNVYLEGNCNDLNDQISDLYYKIM